MRDEAQADAVVSPSGDVVVAAEDVRRLSLVPGQHVTVTITAQLRRRNMHGVLAGRLPDVDPDDIRQVRREVWGELAADQ